MNTQSLNAGLDLEDDPAFSLDKILFDAPEPGQPVELNEDTNIVSLVNRHEDLVYLKNDIRQAGGMSQSFAMEAGRLIPKFLNESNPIGFYTVIPTATRYRLSLEQIGLEQSEITNQVTGTFNKLISRSILKISQAMGTIKEKEERQTLIDLYGSNTNEAKLFFEQLELHYTTHEEIISRVRRLMANPDTEPCQYYLNSLNDKLAQGETKIERLYEAINQQDALYSLASKPEFVERILSLVSRAGQILKPLSAWKQSKLSLFLSDRVDESQLSNVELELGNVLSGITQSAQTTSLSDLSESIRADFKNRGSEVQPNRGSLVKIMENHRRVLIKYPVDQSLQSINLVRSELESLDRELKDFTRKLESSTTNDHDRPLNQLLKTAYNDIGGFLRIIDIGIDFFNSMIWFAKVITAMKKDYRLRVITGIMQVPEADRENILKYFNIKVEGVGNA